MSLAQSENRSLSWRFPVPLCSLMFKQVPNFEIILEMFYRKRLDETLS
jgi:hypothetical protein